MATVTIQEAQARLPDLIHSLTPDDELLITENDRPVAKLISQSTSVRKARQRGSAKGKLLIHAEDDEHLEHFNAVSSQRSVRSPARRSGTGRGDSNRQ